MEILEEYLLDDFNRLFINNSNYRNRKKILEDGAYKIGFGLIEALDLIIYMTKSHENYSIIFSEELSDSSYATLLNDMKSYFYIKTVYAFQINRIIKKFSFKRGKKLHLMRNNWKWNEESVYEYIKSGIFSNSPVLMTNWKIKGMYDIKRWNLIVGLRKYKDGTVDLLIHTGNEIRLLNLKNWFYKKTLYRGLLYYK